MKAIDVLLQKGSVELCGLIKDQLISPMISFIKKHPEFCGAYIFECRKADGFVRDTTSIYLVDSNASFRPICHEKYGRAIAICVSDVNKKLFHSLPTLGVCPMLSSEHSELCTLGLL